MARAGLSYEKVVQVIRDLENRGEKPTINRVREEIGFGSPNTISQFIKAWREGKATMPTPSSNVSVEAAAPKPKPKSQPKQNAPAMVQTIEVVEVGVPDVKPPVVEKSAVERTVEKIAQKSESQRPAEGDNRPHAKSQGGRRIFNKRNNNHQNNHHNNRRQQQHHHQNGPAEPVASYEVLSLERLEQMSQQDLIKQVKRLESILYKEQVRRESCEKMAIEASHYADVIKEQVALRINDLKQTSEVTLEQLKLEMQQARQLAEQDLLFYRQQLDKANRKLSS